MAKFSGSSHRIQSPDPVTNATALFVAPKSFECFVQCFDGLQMESNSVRIELNPGGHVRQCAAVAQVRKEIYLRARVRPILILNAATTRDNYILSLVIYSAEQGDAK